MLFAFGFIHCSNPEPLVHLRGIFVAAAFLGNMSNYTIGRFIGPKV
jgi:membrane protein DedA with SNARE-associated domain